MSPHSKRPLPIGQDIPRNDRAPDWLPMAAFDVTMARTFQDPESPLYWDTIGGCCISPPIGHALTHESGTRGRAMDQPKTGQQSLHKSRWTENWCVGGTRRHPAGPENAMRKLMGMPLPMQTITWAGRAMDLSQLEAELTWRTKMSQDIADTLGEDAAQPFGERAAPGGGDEEESGPAKRLAAKILGPDNLPENWHRSALRGHVKKLLAALRHLVYTRVPARPRLAHTPPDYTHDAELTVQSLPQRLSHADDDDRSYCWRSYELPFDPVCHIAFQLSMMEGRTGQGMSTTDPELNAPWASPDCYQLVNRFLQKQKGTKQRDQA